MSNVKTVLAWANKKHGCKLVKMRTEVIEDATATTFTNFVPSKFGTYYLTTVDMSKWAILKSPFVSMCAMHDGNTITSNSSEELWLSLDKETGEFIRDLFAITQSTSTIKQILNTYSYSFTVIGGHQCLSRTPNNNVPKKILSRVRKILLRYYGYRCIDGVSIDNMAQLDDDDFWFSLRSVKVN